MSSINSTGEGMRSTKSGERTPLRSLQNQLLNSATPSSRLKSKSLSNNDNMKSLKSSIPLCHPYPLSTSHFQTDVTEMDAIELSGETHAVGNLTEEAGFRDITLKSFVCAGGEIEVSDPSTVAEGTILLPKDQCAENNSWLTCGPELTFTSDSMVTPFDQDHADHPYCSAPSARVENACDNGLLNTFPCRSTADVSQALDQSTHSQNAIGGGVKVTFQTFICTGGEQEVCDITGLSEENVPLFNKEILMGCPWQNESVEPSITADASDTQLDQNHKDHPYSNTQTETDSNGIKRDSFKAHSHGTPNTTMGPSDVTLKSLVCLGGELEVADITEVSDNTIPLPTDQFVNTCPTHRCSGISYNAVDDVSLQSSSEHMDHHYCNFKNESTASCNPLVTAEPSICNVDAHELGQVSVGVQSSMQRHATLMSLLSTGGEVEVLDRTSLSEITIPLPKDLPGTTQLVCDDSVLSSIKEYPALEHSEHPYYHVESNIAALDTDHPVSSTVSGVGDSLKTVKHVDVRGQMLSECPQQASSHAAPSKLLDASSSTKEFPATARISTAMKEDDLLAEPCSETGAQASNGAKDSALGSTGNSDKAHAETLSDILTELPEFAAVSNAMQFELFSPVSSGRPMARIRMNRKSALFQALGDMSAKKEAEKSSMAPQSLGPAQLWALDSPMPQPRFNSTALGGSIHSPQPLPQPEEAEDLQKEPCVMETPEEEQAVLDIPLFPQGPLQQQLRQMAQFLLMASGKIGSAPGPHPTAPVELHTACVGTSPFKLVDHSANTSGHFERQRELFVEDACTSTDSLLWNVSPCSLESFPRRELEQRLTSTLIISEALVQQLTAAREQGRPTGGPTPSDLRDRVVQTDHTELSQTDMYKVLYGTALERIKELELDQSCLKSLSDAMQNARALMTALGSDTEAAFSCMKHMEDLVREDHRSLVTQFDQMKCLHAKCMETQGRMVQKVTDTLKESDRMRQQMEEALSAKQAAFSVTEQLRAHCAARIADLEECVGSYQDVRAALTKTYPEQVALNKAYVDSLTLATELLSGMMSDQASLHKEHQAVSLLLRKATPMLVELKEKAAAALTERDLQVSEREQTVLEKEQIQDELDQANSSLQEANQQIGDLNLQVTIMSSEMGVLRQQLSEGEEERAQLEMKVTELSATFSSTLASYAFLEQALAAEADKLQQSRQEVQKVTSKANELEDSLGHSQQRVADLSQALDHREEQLSQLQAHSHGQRLELQRLTEVQMQLQTLQELSEFLQMENELAREQVVESEGLLRANLQGLRQRNIDYEDLKGAYGQLQMEKQALEVELQATRAQASSVQLDLGEQLAQAVTDVTLLHHTLRGLTDDLHSALTHQKPPPSEVRGPQPPLVYERHPSSSFVDSVIVAHAANKGEGEDAGSPAAAPPEFQSGGLLSETSAFTRITPVTPRRCQEVGAGATGPEVEEEEEEHSGVVELLADLGNTVSELSSALGLLRRSKESQLEELHSTIRVLQGEQQSQASRHAAVERELGEQLSRLSSQAERGAQALQQKAQDDKMLTNLSIKVSETTEVLKKQKTTNAELRTEVAELRRSLHQSQVEAQVLREELGKASSLSTHPMDSLDEKIRLLKEVERLKGSIHEGEQARAKLLDRAKRHQAVHQTNQSKLENELHVLDNMIERVRKTLSSIPDVVKNCEKLQGLVEYIG